MKNEIFNSKKFAANQTMAQSFFLAGFTLAEVLITLGIIGVVAAMTIPTLLTRLNQIKLKSQFKEGYSVLAQMVKMYNGDDERKDTVNSQEFYKSFIKYFTGVTDCGNAGTVAVDTPYCIIRNSSVSGGLNRDGYYTNYAKNTNSIDTLPLDDGQFYLMKNNLLIMFDLSHNPKLVSMDINGKGEKPNAWGHDLFTFQLNESEKEGGYELVPMGAPGTPYADSATYCSKTSTHLRNGIGCTYYAAQDEDYFKKLP